MCRGLPLWGPRPLVGPPSPGGAARCCRRPRSRGGRAAGEGRGLHQQRGPRPSGPGGMPGGRPAHPERRTSSRDARTAPRLQMRELRLRVHRTAGGGQGAPRTSPRAPHAPAPRARCGPSPPLPQPRTGQLPRGLPCEPDADQLPSRPDRSLHQSARSAQRLPTLLGRCARLAIWWAVPPGPVHAGPGRSGVRGPGRGQGGLAEPGTSGQKEQARPGAVRRPRPECWTPLPARQPARLCPPPSRPYAALSTQPA